MSLVTACAYGEGGATGTGGPATAAKLAYPVSVAADAFDNLFVSDRGNHRIIRVFRYGAALEAGR